MRRRAARRDQGRAQPHRSAGLALQAVQCFQQRLEGPRRQRRGGVVALVVLEGVQAPRLVDALGFVAEQHGVAVEGDAHLVRVGGRGARTLRVDARRGHAGGQGLAHIGLVGGQEQVGRQRAQVAPGRLAAREHAALHRQPVVLRRAEHAHAAHRVVARKDHHLHAVIRCGQAVVEGQQLVDQREGHARARRMVQTLQLQLHVGAIVTGFEDAVLFFEIEERARRDRDDELAFQGGGHGAVILSL